MTAPKQIVRQRDFSGGEMVAYGKRRDDEAVVRSACRTMRNVRILASGAVERRPGRQAIFQAERTDEVRMTATSTFRLCFGAGTLRVRNSQGTSVALATGLAWTTDTLDQIVWAQTYSGDIVIAFDQQIPKLVQWDGISTWTIGNWAAYVTSGGQKRVPFYRISPKNITMLPSGRTGTVNVAFSSAVLVAGHVGTRMRFVNRQLTIATVTGATTGTATVNEPLPGSQLLTFTTDPSNIFAPDEAVEGSATGARGYVTSVTSTTIRVQLLTTAVTQGLVDYYSIGSAAFQITDSVVGPGGALTPSAVGTIGNPVAVPVWDEEVMNAHQNWPRSCSYDQNRLIFTDFPSIPGGIAWSALLTQDDFYPDSDPTDAIFETVPRRARVYHVSGGADEFVLTNQGVYYIPISEANPLRPGSVSFRRIPGPSGSAVKPVETGQGTLFVNNGRNRVLAIVGTGQTAMPWIIRPVSDLHADLFAGIRGIAVEEGDGTPPGEFVYVTNNDGTVAVGRHQPGKEWVGWVKWDGVGAVKWVSALGAIVVFSVGYAAGSLCERLDAAYYLDAANEYQSVPASLVPGVGQGVLWYLASQTLDVMQSLRYIGTRVIDATGAVVLLPGDTFDDEVFGLGFDGIVEPFLAHVQGGQSVAQTMHLRAISRGAVAVQSSTGFRVEYYEPTTATWKTAYDRPPYEGGENQDASPPQREEVVTFTVKGSNHDPRIRVIKDTPGPLRLLEIGVEIGA